MPDLLDPYAIGCREQHDDGSAFGALTCAHIDADHDGPHYDPVLDVYWHADADSWVAAQPIREEPRSD